MDEVLFGVFAESIGRYLESIDRLATATQTAHAAHAEELRRLAAAWRALLDIHQPTGRRGRCAGCDPPARALLAVRRRGAAMCSVWRVASAFFVRRLPDER